MESQVEAAGKLLALLLDGYDGVLVERGEDHASRYFKVEEIARLREVLGMGKPS